MSSDNINTLIYLSGQGGKLSDQYDPRIYSIGYDLGTGGTDSKLNPFGDNLIQKQSIVIDYDSGMTLVDFKSKQIVTKIGDGKTNPKYAIDVAVSAIGSVEGLNFTHDSAMGTNNCPVVGNGVFYDTYKTTVSQTSFSGFQSQIPFIIPLEDVTGISNVQVENVIVSANYKSSVSPDVYTAYPNGSFVLSGVAPLFFDDVKTGQRYSILLLAVSGTEATLPLGQLTVYDETNTAHIITPKGIVYPPIPNGSHDAVGELYISVSCTIRCNIINIDGVNLQVLNSNRLVTDGSLSDVIDALNNLTADVDSMNTMLQWMNEYIKETATNLQDVMDALRNMDSERKPGVLNSIYDWVWKAVEGLASLIPTAGPVLALSISGIKSVVDWAIDYYKLKEERGMSNGRVGAPAQVLMEIFVTANRRYLTIEDLTEKIDVVISMFDFDIDEVSSVTMMVTNISRLDGLGKYLLNQYITQVRYLEHNTLIPVHSITLTSGYTTEITNLGKYRDVEFTRHNVLVSVGDKSFGSLVSVTLSGKPLFASYEWDGDPSILPSSYLQALGGRQLKFVDYIVSAVPMEEMLRFINYIKANDEKYDIIFNNCHDTSHKIMNFARTGILPPYIEDI